MVATARVYLDHNASTPLRPAAAESMVRALATSGNPSSVHAEGRAARAAIESARSDVASALKVAPRDVIFTSGATEAIATLLRPSPAVRLRGAGRPLERLFVLATEHSAVLSGGSFAPAAVERIPVAADGRADLRWLASRLGAAAEGAGEGSAMVAMQVANGETGVLQPLREAATIVRDAGALLVADAVAALGKIEDELASLGADALVVSAHKCGGPKGTGAIVLVGDRLALEAPLLAGGGQERGYRAGTENVPALVGMGIAIREALAERAVALPRMAALRNRLIDGLRAVRPDLVVLGEAAPRLPQTVAIAVPGLPAETAVIALDLAGVAVSSGSACSSGKVRRSHVLEAMGVPSALAACALRFSLGWTTTEAEIDQAIAAFARIAWRITQPAAA